MKFPVDIEKYIQTQEALEGFRLKPDARMLCKRFLDAANRVYHDALSGKIDENPFSGNIEEDVADFQEKNGTINQPDVFIELMRVLYKWCTLAYEQGIQERKVSA